MSLQFNDLRNLVRKKIHIDQYKSKMGNDDDVIVLSFKIKYLDPAKELTNFFEKGYDFVLDADVSAGEMADGDYLVFVEMLRRPTVPEHIVRILEDLENVTGNKASSYKFAYHTNIDYLPISLENLEKIVPLTPSSYRKIHGETDNTKEMPEKEAQIESKRQLDNMIMAAGLAPKSVPITDPVLKHYVNWSKR